MTFEYECPNCGAIYVGDMGFQDSTDFTVFCDECENEFAVYAELEVDVTVSEL